MPLSIRRALPGRLIGRLAVALPGTCAVLGLALALGASPAQAQNAEYPTRPVTVITPFPSGAGPDTVLRIVMDKVSKQWGQPIIVDNRPGAAGFIAIDAAKRAAPDGYTLLQLDSEHMSALPLLYKSKNFAPFQQFEPIGTLFNTPFFVAVPTDSKWQNMRDLIQAAKAAPGKINYGSWGVGSPGHLGALQLEVLTGIQMQHVPFKEISQLYANVGAGELNWAFGTIASSQGIYRSGKLRYIAIAAPKRVPQFPNVPTVGEAGGPPESNVSGFVVVLGPKGLPGPVGEKVGASIAKALTDPEIRSRLDGFVFEPITWTPAEVKRQVETRSVLYDQLIKRGNISLD
jgi:tripartite-type tricarboxylate transporter receptor subunit TctC